MASAVEQIKSRLNITEVVGSYIKLEKAGANFRARCPFHNEKTPSFYVSPDRGSYHCFGCNKGGDLISFVEEIEGVDFLGALEVLAAKAGIELKDYDWDSNDKSRRLYKLLDEATNLYTERLWQSPAALDYLRGRGLTDDTIKKWRLGFAPDSWSFIYDALKARGYRDEELDQVGLVSQSTNAAARGRSYYDRFRSRIMFPLGDQTGRIVGYSGRIFGATKDDGAKYVNTPATLLYDKSSILYGLDRAKAAIRRAEAAILVEGQMDLILSHQAGVENVVAVSGTALTDKHLTIIKRLTDNLIMAFDGDAAGIKAARRALGLALMLGMEVRVAEMPAGLDPADLILKDPALWRAATAGARPVIDFFLSVIVGRGLEARQLGREVTREVLPLVKLLTSPIDQAHYITKIAATINSPEEAIRAELQQIKSEEILNISSAPVVAPVAATISENKVHSYRLLRRLLGLLWWQASLVVPTIDYQAINTELETVLTAPVWQGLSNSLVGDKPRLILEAELAYDGMEKLSEEASELARNLQINLLKEELEKLTIEVRTLELQGQAALLDQVLRRCQEITKLINDIKS